MSSQATIPGLYYTFVRPPGAKSPLRTDVAGFFGRTKRGPAGIAVRVEGWREFESVFGGLMEDANTPYAVEGYFENWATTAYIVRLLGEGAQTASGKWTAGNLDPVTGKPDKDWPGDSNFPALSFGLQATSQGDWANGMTFVVRYWAHSASGDPELEIEVTPVDEPVELLTGIQPANIVEEVNARSAYVMLNADALPAGITKHDLQANPGPRYKEWPPVVLAGGSTMQPVRTNYLDAVTALGDESEVALVVSPDLYDETLSFPDDQNDVIESLLTQADALHDRLVILDVPPSKKNAECSISWVATLRTNFPNEHLLRNAAVYHPMLTVPDALGTAANPLRAEPCSGLVTGVISRLDKQLGPYATPANAAIYQAVDLAQRFDAKEEAALYEGGINLLKCSRGQGLLVWGGRVLGTATDGPGGFVAHRRLIHVLVKAIRRVAEPLVFDTNGPQLWLAFTRSITSVLLEAFRAGALQGTRPEEAFRVKCDAETNPPENIDNGICICEILVAPAVPMEFITLRVAVSDDGTLEVFEK